MAKDIFEDIDKAATGAALSNNNSEPVFKPRSKSLKNIPGAYFEKHQHLKDTGKTSLDFTAYIIEATREKLERDGVL